MRNKRLLLALGLLSIVISTPTVIYNLTDITLHAFDNSKDPFDNTEDNFGYIIESEKPPNDKQDNQGRPKDSVEEDCVDEVDYIPSRPMTINNDNINSVENYSPTNIGHGWYTFDHIGYKDTAFKGERHVAYSEENSGVHFFGYDSEGLTDLMLLPHEAKNTQTVSILQSPTRADWHTLNGNGLMFGIESTGLPNEPTDININNKSSGVSITGYSAVATESEIQIREYTNTPVENLGQEGTYTVLYKEPKECLSVDFSVNINGNEAEVYLSGRKLGNNINLKTKGRDTGIVVSYAEHGCESLSSVYTYSHMVDQIEYLKQKEV